MIIKCLNSLLYSILFHVFVKMMGFGAHFDAQITLMWFWGQREVQTPFSFCALASMVTRNKGCGPVWICWQWPRRSIIQQARRPYNSQIYKGRSLISGWWAVATVWRKERYEIISPLTIGKSHVDQTETWYWLWSRDPHSWMVTAMVSVSRI